MSNAKKGYERQDLFNFMLKRVRETASAKTFKEPQAFAYWFMHLFYSSPQDILLSDGSRDGKVDACFYTVAGTDVHHYAVNSKFTASYDEPSPRAFYDEITAFYHMFEDKRDRKAFLAGKAVKDELKSRYKSLFELYDEGKASLVFVTNCNRNDPQYEGIKNIKARIIHLDDLIQYMIDDIEGAMPHTPEMRLVGVRSVLTPDIEDCDIPTSILFARVTDLISYMQKDPYDLLFARNIRLTLGNTEINKEIAATFDKQPKEFAFSNNGITMICDKYVHELGKNEVIITNPRVVNGSQTLHSVRNVADPSPNARVMIRTIKIETDPAENLSETIKRRKDIIEKISTRSNRQNPIKKSDLVSNDDFQHDLARMFRSKNLYYERRQKEWNSRSRELQSVGVKCGPTLRGLMQLVASFFWKDALLGPAVAKVSVGALFNDEIYKHIKRKADLNLAYAIYSLATIVNAEFTRLLRKKKYIRPLKGHIKLTLFAYVVKSLEVAGVIFHTKDFLVFLEEYQSAPKSTKKQFMKLVKGAIDFIYKDYKRNKKLNKELSLNTYFKSKKDIDALFAASVPDDIKKSATEVKMLISEGSGK